MGFIHNCLLILIIVPFKCDLFSASVKPVHISSTVTSFLTSSNAQNDSEIRGYFEL